MSIISKETWNKFTEEEKRKNRERYQRALTNGDRKLVHEIETLFGKENLQPEPESKIKTWGDVEFNINEHYCKLDLALGSILPTSKDDKLRLKIKATYKIAKLIELGYGGMVTEEEWNDRDKIKYCLSRVDNRIFYSTRTDHFLYIAFHTDQQREEFMSYPENRQLVEQYYMI